MRIVGAGDERSERHPPALNFHVPLIRDFAEAVINKREPCVDGETGRMVAMIEEKIYARGGENEGEPG